MEQATTNNFFSEHVKSYQESDGPVWRAQTGMMTLRNRITYDSIPIEQTCSSLFAGVHCFISFTICLMFGVCLEILVLC